MLFRSTASSTVGLLSAVPQKSASPSKQQQAMACAQQLQHISSLQDIVRPQQRLKQLLVTPANSLLLSSNEAGLKQPTRYSRLPTGRTSSSNAMMPTGPSGLTTVPGDVGQCCAQFLNNIKRYRTKSMCMCARNGSAPGMRRGSLVRRHHPCLPAAAVGAAHTWPAQVAAGGTAHTDPAASQPKTIIRRGNSALRSQRAGSIMLYGGDS